MFDRYARWTVVWRWPILLVWGLGLLLLLVLPPVDESGNELASIIPSDSPAIRSEARALQEFGFPLSTRTAVVQHDPRGLSVYVQAESVLDAIALDQGPKPAYPLLGALPLSNTVRLVGSLGETNTAVITYLFMEPSSSFASQRDAAQRYIAEHLERPEDHVVGITGSIPARAEQASIVTESLPRLELLTVLSILALVGITFQSVVVPVLALTAAGVSLIVTIGLSGVLGQMLGVVSPAELEPLLVALLLGVVTDYTIFYVTALQHRLQPGRDWRDAVRGAIAADTPIVVAAGLTVAAGTAALLAARSEFFRGFGPAMALAVLVGLAVSVTLVPAALAVLGPRVFWPRDGRRHPVLLSTVLGRRVSAGASAALRRLHLLERMTRRRVAAGVVIAAVALLAVASLPVRHLDLGVGFTSSLPSDNPVSRASRAASEAFAPGITSPTTLLVEQPQVSGQRDALTRLQGLVSAEPGVAGVIGPAQNFTRSSYNVFLSKSGNAARMLVVLEHDPLDATAVGDLGRLRTRLPLLAEQSGLGGAQISIGGDTALAEGLVRSTAGDLWRIAVAAIVVNLILLLGFLRALVAPLYLLASSILALTASLGLTVWVFMDLSGGEGLTFYVPFAAAVLLVALGSDYNIFGVGRVWEEARHRPLRPAVLKAVPESSRAITTAGLTLAVSFGMLAMIPLTPFRELGFAMACGILLDAFLVRSVLVPSLLILVGPASGWPGPHLRAGRADARRARRGRHAAR